MDANEDEVIDKGFQKVPPMDGKATLAKISGQMPGRLQDMPALNLANQGISEIDDLSICLSLRRIDLRHNYLTSLKFLSSLSLTWAHLADNELESIHELLSMTSLNVLNVSANKIVRLEGLYNLHSLKALIASNNKMRFFDSVGSLPSLNSLVLSHNEIESAKSLVTFPALAKLSLSHNSLRVVPNLMRNTALRELRLNDNKIVVLPPALVINRALKLIDLGNNIMTDFKTLEVLQSLPLLTNLNLKGNPLCKTEGYREKVLELLPNLYYLDGQPTPLNVKALKKQEHKKHVKLRELKKQKKSDKTEKSKGESDPSDSPASPTKKMDEKDSKPTAKASITTKAKLTSTSEALPKKAKKLLPKAQTGAGNLETDAKEITVQETQPQSTINDISTTQPKKVHAPNPFDLVAKKKFVEPESESKAIAVEEDSSAKSNGQSQKQSKPPVMTKKRKQTADKVDAESLTGAKPSAEKDSGVLLIKENKKKKKGPSISVEDWAQSRWKEDTVGDENASGWDD